MTHYVLNKQKAADVNYIKSLMTKKAQTSCIPSMLILGEPGSGKTSFAKHVSEKLKTELIFAPCYDGVGAEQLVYNWDLGKLVDAMTDEKTKGREAMKDGYLLQALKKSQTQKVILLIDEIDKATPATDTFLLSFLQECMLNDPITGVIRGKKENLFIIFTSNERRELEDALDRRFTMIREFNFPDRAELFEQINPIVSKDYSRTKLWFLVDLAINYRKLKVNRKPSQNQIADLTSELHSLDKSNLGKKTTPAMKFDSLLWKFSQEKTDHAIFVDYLTKNIKLKKKVNMKNYVGSMI